MPIINLEIRADGSQVNSELQNMAGEFTDLNSESKKFTTDTKKGFKEVGDEAKKANDEIANPKPTENQKKQLSAIQQLKNEIKQATSLALKAGEGTAEWSRQLAIAGNKKADLKDLQEAVAALDPDAVAGGFLRLGSSIAGGFAVAQGAIALAGDESKNLEKALLKVQAAQAILAGLQELANAKDEIGKVKLILLNKIQTKELAIQAAAMEVQIALTGAQSAEVIALTEAQAVQTAATGKLTIAQRILNIAMKANPVGIIISAVVAIGALVGALALKAAATERATRIEKLQSEAIDGTIIKDKELRDSYNEQVIKLNELNNEYAVLNGTMTEHGAALDNIALKNKLAVDTINKDTRTKLEEAGSFWNKLGNDMASASANFFGAATGDERRLDLQSKELLKINESAATALKIQEDKKNNDILAANLEADKKKKDAYKKYSDDLLNAQKDFNAASLDLAKKVRQAEIDNLTGVEKVQAQERESLIEIDILRKTLEEKSKLAGLGGKLSLEQENQFAILRNQILLKSGQEQIDIEKTIQDKIDSDAKEALEKKQAEAEKAFTDELKRIEDHSKAQVLLTKSGSADRLRAEIDEIQKAANFKKTQAGLSADEVIIIEKEAQEKILALRKDLAKKEGFSWAKLLGVSDEEFQKIQQSLGSILNSAKSINDSLLQQEQEALDKRKEINDDVLKANEDRIKSLEDQLKDELELQKEGFASRVDLINQSLAKENEERKKALIEEKAISDEQVAIKKRQAAADSIQQVAALLSATATLYAQGAFEGIPGILAATATIASMIAAFISIRNKLQTAGFKDGGYTGDVGASEVAGVVHGREFVSTERTTTKHRPLLEALHTENYSDLKLGDIQPILEGAKFNIETLNQIEKEGNNYHQNKNNFAAETLSENKKMNKNFSKFFEHVKNKPVHGVDEKGNTFTIIGNTKRTIRKK